MMRPRAGSIQSPLMISFCCWVSQRSASLLPCDNFSAGSWRASGMPCGLRPRDERGRKPARSRVPTPDNWRFPYAVVIRLDHATGTGTESSSVRAGATSDNPLPWQSAAPGNYAENHCQYNDQNQDSKKDLKSYARRVNEPDETKKCPI